MLHRKTCTWNMAHGFSQIPSITSHTQPRIWQKQKRTMCIPLFMKALQEVIGQSESCNTPRSTLTGKFACSWTTIDSESNTFFTPWKRGIFGNSQRSLAQKHSEAPSPQRVGEADLYSPRLCLCTGHSVRVPQLRVCHPKRPASVWGEAKDSRPWLKERCQAVHASD